MSPREFYVLAGHRCEMCNGVGLIPGFIAATVPCPKCNGAGGDEVRVPLSEALAEMGVATHCRCVTSNPVLEAWVCNECKGVCS